MSDQLLRMKKINGGLKLLHYIQNTSNSKAYEALLHKVINGVFSQKTLKKQKLTFNDFKL